MDRDDSTHPDDAPKSGEALTLDALVARAKAKPGALLADEALAFVVALPELEHARLRSRLKDEKIAPPSGWVAIIKDRRDAAQVDAPRSTRPASWRDALTCGRDGSPDATPANLRTILENRYAGRLAFNRMAKVAWFDDGPLDDHAVTGMRIAICQYEGVTFGKEEITDVAAFAGKEMRSFHPVQEYLRGLRWDGVRRLDRAAHELLGIAESDALSAVMLRRTLIAMVARGLVEETAAAADATPEDREGQKADTVAVLLGPQGAKKSTFWRALGGAWFGDSKVDITDRKGAMTMATKWIYEWPEVDRVVARHNDSETKAFISQQDDSFIPMYGRSSITALRGWVPVGTTNKPRFLTDATGNRRWWVLDLRSNGPRWKVDIRKVRAARDQLFAEAVAEFDAFMRLRREGVAGDQNPHRWWLNDAEEAERDGRTVRYQVENSWTETVGKWLAGELIPCPMCKGSGKFAGDHDCNACAGIGSTTREALPEHGGRQYVTLAMVLTHALGVPPERQKRANLDAIDTLAELGWRTDEKVDRIRNANGIKVTPYYAPPEPPKAAEPPAAPPTLEPVHDVATSVEPVDEAAVLAAEHKRLADEAGAEAARLAAEAPPMGASVPVSEAGAWELGRLAARDDVDTA